MKKPRLVTGGVFLLLTKSGSWSLLSRERARKREKVAILERRIMVDVNCIFQRVEAKPDTVFRGRIRF
jgi:hypothetical protein